jgi:hypothetical protein
LIDHEASSGYMPLTIAEVYRINRIRIAREFHIDPRIVDDWDSQTYYDAMEVIAAEIQLGKLR